MATWAVLVLIYCLTAVLAAQRPGVPLGGFVAPATVVGVALGFGAQRIVQDVLAGFLMVAERQYGFGDLVRLDERDLASADARADGVKPPIPASAASSLPVP